uniref:Uncharacterized protein n=1 Tax=Tanacetum cinerariifolium TaxID=118510 RepID=A0A699QKR9_TANCI|nr:hypothetical protein [Tanacetum cinerariifolium]
MRKKTIPVPKILLRNNPEREANWETKESNGEAYSSTEDLDSYDSDCDDVSNAKAVLMANLSNYASDVM